MAQVWSHQYLHQLTPTIIWQKFVESARGSFGDSDPGASARLQIRKVEQKKKNVNNYIVKFEEHELLTSYTFLFRIILIILFISCHIVLTTTTSHIRSYLQVSDTL